MVEHMMLQAEYVINDIVRLVIRKMFCVERLKVK